MDNFEYVDMDKIQLKTGEGDEKPDEKVLDIPENIMDQIRLVSTYKGVHVPSMMFGLHRNKEDCSYCQLCN